MNFSSRALWVTSLNKYLGCSGFYYWHWRGLFYPQELPTERWLEYYAEHFNALEINSSFYHWPRESTLKSWVKKTPSEFKLVLKANREITHVKRFKNAEHELERFYNLASTLQEKLAGVLFQLPPSIHKDLGFLKSMLSQLNQEYKNFIEFRHKSWFCEEVYREMEKMHACFCSVSAPKSSGIPEEVVKTTDDVYVRFHGAEQWYKHEYSDKELNSWAMEIKRVRPKTVYAFFNNDFNASAPRNCLKLKKLLNGD